MSVALMAHAFKTKLQPGPKLVLLALCDHANDLGECFPSTNMLSEKSSLSARHVFNCLAELERGGFLTREKRPGRSTIYQITNPATWVNPCNEFTPELSSPLNSVHTTPEMSSYPPLNSVHTTPEMSSDITIKEPPIEPPRNRKREPAPKNNQPKLKFGKFQNVKLSQQEYDTLFAEQPDKAQAAIDRLDAYIGAKGDKYKSHYMAMHSWVLKAVDEDRSKGRHSSRASPYCRPLDKLDEDYIKRNPPEGQSVLYQQPEWND